MCSSTSRPAHVNSVARLLDLTAVQLHGDEDPRDFLRIGRRVIKGVGVAESFDEDALRRMPAPVTILLDAHDPTRRGGTGRTIDWATAARVSAARRTILSGGLTPANVAAAVAEVRPYAIDVSSGVESAPGVKDHDMLRAFFHALEGATTSGARTVRRAVSHFPFSISHPMISLPSFGRRDPDARGYYGAYGGRFVPETLVAPVEELERAYFEARKDAAFTGSLVRLLTDYVGRPTPLYEARRLSASLGGARVFLKREDLAHTGAHKINNALGQALLAVRMGKRRVIAETGAGQHGVATATACALLGLECDVYMGAADMERQALNVFRMQLLGATVRRVDAGSRTLKDAINEAMRDWVASVADSYYLLGSVLGPHPYPLMVREFQSVIGAEARAQCLDAIGRLPDAIVACVGGGSNAMGLFDAFIDDRGVRLIGVEAGGRGIEPGQHAARFSGGSSGVLQGTRSYVLQDEHGNIEATHSVSAGLDYAAVGPEHAWLHDSKRAEYTWIGDDDALTAFQRLAREEGILPALESSHAVACACRIAPEMGRDQALLVNISGRGDKDVTSVQQILAQEGRR